MTKTLSLIAAALLSAAAASAASLDWNKDLASQAGVQGVQTIQAQPLGADAINHVVNDWDEQVELMLNNDGDRVGAEFTACDPSTENSSDQAPTCEYLEFVFTGLTVQGKSILWNGESVGQVKKGFFSTHVKLNKGYKLRVIKQGAVIDRGFDRDHVARVAVYLEKTN